MGVEIIEMKKRTPEDRDAYLAIKVAEGKARIRELEAENERLDESVTWHAAENERHIRELEEARDRLCCTSRPICGHVGDTPRAAVDALVAKLRGED